MVICGADHESGTRNGVSGKVFEIHYACVTALNGYFQHFTPPLYDIAGDSERKSSVSGVI